MLPCSLATPVAHLSPMSTTPVSCMATERHYQIIITLTPGFSLAINRLGFSSGCFFYYYYEFTGIDHSLMSLWPQPPPSSQHPHPPPSSHHHRYRTTATATIITTLSTTTPLSSLRSPPASSPPQHHYTTLNATISTTTTAPLHHHHHHWSLDSLQMRWVGGAGGVEISKQIPASPCDWHSSTVTSRSLCSAHPSRF